MKPLPKPSKEQRFDAWFESTYPSLTGHGIWLKGGELNTLKPDVWNEREFRILFARLSTYYDTADSFTHSYLYQLAMSLEGVFPDLAFLPPLNDVEIFRRDAIPFLLGTQTKRPGLAFDLIGFSNSTLQELLNLPRFLVSSGIPLSKKLRLQDPKLPLVLLGGANALYSGVAWGEDPWVDAVYHGESAEGIVELLRLCQDGKQRGLSKTELLTRLREVEGVLIPDEPKKVKKRMILELDRSPLLESGPVMYTEEQAGSGQIQISEGCPCFCSFCAESWDRKPYRERSLTSLVSAAKQAKAKRGLHDADLYSFNFNMHSQFYPLLWKLVELFKSVGMKSQRFDLLAHDAAMADMQHVVEKASFTCGLEGVSDRLRVYLTKNLAIKDIRNAIAAILRSRCRELKIFLIATGLEEERDFQEFGEFLADLKKLRTTCHSSARMIFSMTPLVRFPWTPLEFEDAPTTEVCSKIIAKTSGMVRREGFEFREAADLPEYWVSQVMVRAMDPRIKSALESVLKESEFLFFRKISHAFQSAFRTALEERGLNQQALLKGADVELTDYPWLWVETGVRRDFVVARWREIQKGVQSEYCLGRSWVPSRCMACGGCPTPEHVKTIVSARQERPYSVEAFRERIKKFRAAEGAVMILVRVGDKGRGVSRRIFAVALARAMMMAHADYVSDYRGFKLGEFADDLNECWFTGEDVIELRFLKPSVQRLLGQLDDPRWREAVNVELDGWGEVLGSAPSAWRPRKVVLSGKRPRIEEWLKSQGYKFSTRRRSPDECWLEFAKESLKKGVFEEVILKTHSNATEVTLTVGPKFKQEHLVRAQREGFRAEGEEDWVRVRCEVNPCCPVEG